MGMSAPGTRQVGRGGACRRRGHLGGRREPSGVPGGAPRAERRSGWALASPGGRCRKSRSARATYPVALGSRDLPGSVRQWRGRMARGHTRRYLPVARALARGTSGASAPVAPPRNPKGPSMTPKPTNLESLVASARERLVAVEIEREGTATLFRRSPEGKVEAETVPFEPFLLVAGGEPRPEPCGQQPGRAPGRPRRPHGPGALPHRGGLPGRREGAAQAHRGERHRPRGAPTASSPTPCSSSSPSCPPGSSAAWTSPNCGGCNWTSRR